MSVKFKISHNDFQKAYNLYMDLKVTALKQLYHSVGEQYKVFVRDIIPTEDIDVLKAFRYRVVPTKYDIKLLVGILTKQDLEKMENFYKWLLYGSDKHWVSLKHLSVLRWSLANNIIQEVGGKYYFVKHPLYYSSGTPKSTRAVQVSTKPIEPYLLRIQQRIITELHEEVLSIMEGK